MDKIEGQMTIFDPITPIDYIYWIAKELKEHCKYWKYDKLDKLSMNKTVENFMKLFCKITKTYFFKVYDDMYGVEFNSDGTGKVYKCGKHPEITLEVIKIENLLEQI